MIAKVSSVSKTPVSPTTKVVKIFTASSEKETVTALLSKAGININGNQPWDIRVLDETFYRTVLSQGSLGLGESYMDGMWECDALDEFFNKILNARLEKEVRPLFLMGQVLKAKALNLQDKIRSKKVAEVHYNLGNDFYETMLDPWMQYTCAYWKNAKDLETAQENKLHLICQKLNLKPGERVLELGCGWGGFARFAATYYGVEVVAYNISREQVKYAREKTEGLTAEFRLQDYRDAKGYYDKAVSIGMGEHIGYKNYRKFFELVNARLKPGGLFLFHTIGNNRTSVISEPWLDRYIFPGSLLPSMAQLTTAFEDLFVMEDWHNFGADYDKTLMAWNDNFKEAWEKEGKAKDKFYRMWEYYLLMCAGSFRSRKNQLWQVVLSKGGEKGGYHSIR